METRPSVSHVHAFWNTEACGTQFVERCADEKEFFEKFREHRYRTEWHIPFLVPFAEAKGKQLLEIGTGNGADGVMFALNGALYTGVDLTEAALEATRKHFQLLGLTGTFQKENAEQLGFPDKRFEIVYSHGVLHHSPNTGAAVDEVYRVLKPGGWAIIMLYHRHSFNYYARIMTAMRLRVLLFILRRAVRWRTDRERIGALPLAGGARQCRPSRLGNPLSELSGARLGLFESQKFPSPLYGRPRVPHCLGLQPGRGARIVFPLPQRANQSGPFPLEQVPSWQVASLLCGKVSRVQNRLVPVYLCIEMSASIRERLAT